MARNSLFRLISFAPTTSDDFRDLVDVCCFFIYHNTLVKKPEEPILTIGGVGLNVVEAQLCSVIFHTEGFFSFLTKTGGAMLLLAKGVFVPT